MILVYSIVVALLVPEPAWAWGPGTHLEIALHCLGQAALFLPVVRHLLKRYPEEFIYGSVSPDIIQGKKFAGVKHHCHNWDIGMKVLQEAATDTARAAAYGYLTHLAADCVAHNYFVPYKMIRSFQTRSLSHTYWEMRFDLQVPEAAWQKMPQVICRDYTEFDHHLEGVLKRTLFTFRTNKKIFNTLLTLQKMKRLRATLTTYAKASRWSLREERVAHYKTLTFATVEEFLKRFGEADCLRADPAGLRKQSYAKEMRRQLKQWSRSGKLPVSRAPYVLETIRKALFSSLFDPNVPLPHLEDLL